MVLVCMEGGQGGKVYQQRDPLQLLHAFLPSPIHDSETGRNPMLQLGVPEVSDTSRSGKDAGESHGGKLKGQGACLLQ